MAMGVLVSFMLEFWHTELTKVGSFLLSEVWHLGCYSSSCPKPFGIEVHDQSPGITMPNMAYFLVLAIC